MPISALPKRIAASSLACAVAACSLSTSLDGLTSDAAPRAAHDASAHDPATDFDAAPDDAAIDAGRDAKVVVAVDAANDSHASAPDSASPPIDAGCVASGDVALGGATTLSPVFGGSGGAPFTDTCPGGTALVGLKVVTASISPQSISQIQGLCASLSRRGCSVVVGAPSAMVNHGYTTGTAGSVTCPADTAIVGIRVTSGTLVDSLSIACAPLVVSGSGGASFARGAITVVGPVGGSGGGPNPAFDCPSPMIVNQLRGQVGDWIEQAQLGCATP